MHPLAKREVGWLWGGVRRMTGYAQGPKTERRRHLHVKRAFVRLNIYSSHTALNIQAPVLVLLHIVGVSIYTIRISDDLRQAANFGIIGCFPHDVTCMAGREVIL